MANETHSKRRSTDELDCRYALSFTHTRRLIYPLEFDDRALGSGCNKANTHTRTKICESSGTAKGRPRSTLGYGTFIVSLVLCRSAAYRWYPNGETYSRAEWHRTLLKSLSMSPIFN